MNFVLLMVTKQPKHVIGVKIVQCRYCEQCFGGMGMYLVYWTMHGFKGAVLSDVETAIA